MNISEDETRAQRQARLLDDASEAQEIAKLAPNARSRAAYVEITLLWLNLALGTDNARGKT